jgi:3-oxoacyl-[acyl-carrier protein] reductase
MQNTERPFDRESESLAMPLVDLTAKTALVTGSSRGIGRAIAITLASCGADLILAGRSPGPELISTRDAILSLGRRCHLVTADIAVPSDRVRLVEESWEWAKNVPIWVNNAGADCLTGTNASLPFTDKLTLLCHTDLTGTMELTRLAAARMKIAGEGCVVNVGWDQAISGMAGDSGQLFGAIKGGIMAFTLAAAKTYAPHVRINCVAPGWIKTAWGETASAEWQQRAVDESLAGRWGIPQDIANVCAFLVSPAASFVNGQVIYVNGGFAGSRPQRVE